MVTPSQREASGCSHYLCSDHNQMMYLGSASLLLLGISVEATMAELPVVELPVVSSGVLGVASEGSSGVSVSVKSDMHSLAEDTRGRAIASPSPGLDAGSDCSHAGSPE